MRVPGQGNKAGRVGDWVEVRPLEEIMATLDPNGRLEGLPFMPEMARYCGERFQVVKSAHKTCDPTGETNLRSMPNAVHLPTRCDGSAHDGCEARCLLYWKTAWLKPADGPVAGAAGPGAPLETDSALLQRLHADTRYAGDDDSDTRYRCQATEIIRATTPLRTRDLGQYVRDVASGNVPVGQFVRHFAAAVWQSLAEKSGRILARSRKPPNKQPLATVTQPQTSCPGFRAGDIVQVRPLREIAATLDENGKYRGLSFEDEMKRYSGGTFRVDYRPAQIIDERTGRKIRLGKDCIVLDGLVCAGLDNRGRLFCPRSSFYYWREAWLKPVSDTASDSPQAAPS